MYVSEQIFHAQDFICSVGYQLQDFEQSSEPGITGEPEPEHPYSRAQPAIVECQAWSMYEDEDG